MLALVPTVLRGNAYRNLLARRSPREARTSNPLHLALGPPRPPYAFPRGTLETRRIDDASAFALQPSLPKRRPMADHDSSYRQFFSHPRMVQDLLEGFVHEDGVAELDFAILEPVHRSFVSEDLERREDDVIWRVRCRNEWLYIYLLIEFQSQPDPWMALRMLVNIGLVYQQLVRTASLSTQGRLPVLGTLSHGGPWERGYGGSATSRSVSRSGHAFALVRLMGAQDSRHRLSRPEDSTRSVQLSLPLRIVAVLALHFAASQARKSVRSATDFGLRFALRLWRYAILIARSIPAPHRARQYFDGEAGALASSPPRLRDLHRNGTFSNQWRDQKSRRRNTARLLLC